MATVFQWNRCFQLGSHHAASRLLAGFVTSVITLHNMTMPGRSQGIFLKSLLQRTLPLCSCRPTPQRAPVPMPSSMGNLSSPWSSRPSAGPKCTHDPRTVSGEIAVLGDSGFRPGNTLSGGPGAILPGHEAHGNREIACVLHRGVCGHSLPSSS